MAGPTFGPSFVVETPIVHARTRRGGKYPQESRKRMSRTPTVYDPESVRVPSRWELIRDVIVFQGKLAVDGLRDLIWAPVSVGLAVMDLLGVGKNAGLHFYNFVHIGQKTEHFINLFGAADYTEPDAVVKRSSEGLDALVNRLEKTVRQEYERGGITTSAKDAVDRALDSLQKK